jgi:hypothetical protein
VSLIEASEIVGMPTSKLRRRVRALGIETKKDASRRLIPVAALDLLHESRWGG